MRRASASVSLEHAWAWTCPACQRRNFHEGDEIDLEPEEREKALRDLHDLEDWQELPEDADGQFFQAPTAVQCQCGEHFDTEDEDDDDEVP